MFVEVDGNVKLASDTLAEAAGQVDTVIHGHAGDRDEGDDIDGTDARMRTAVRGHVDQLDSFAHELERPLQHGLRLADEGDDRAIGIGAGIDVEQRHSGHARRRGGHGLIHFLASSF